MQPGAGLAQLPGMAGGGLARPQLQMELVRQQSVSRSCVCCDRALAGVCSSSRSGIRAQNQALSRVRPPAQVTA